MTDEKALIETIRAVLYPRGDENHEWSPDELDTIAQLLKAYDDSRRPGQYDMDKLPMLDALLCGKKLLPLKPTRIEVEMLHKAVEKEHQYLLEHEPPDEFHACVLLGALNLLGGMLKRKPGEKV